MSDTQNVNVERLFFEERQRHDRIVADLAANEDIYNRILEALRAAKIITVSTSYGLSVAVYGDANSLQAIFGNLRRLGLTPSARPEIGETDYEAFWRNEDGVTKLWLSFTSTQCVKVKVGTKTTTIEEPIYETRCA